MVKALAALLILLALAAGGAFLATGAGEAPAASTGLAASLGPAAGHPGIAAGSLVAFALGVALAGRAAGPEQRYALREVLVLVCAGGGVACGVAVVLGVGRAWSAPTLATLALSGAGESLAGTLLCVWLAVGEERRKGLFVPGLLLTVLLDTAYLVVFLLGSS